MFACCEKGAPKTFDYLIVGGGVAAGYACREFVKQGVGKGKIGMIMAEPVVPYERPALTKAYLHPPGSKARPRLPGFHTCVGSGGDRQEPSWYEEKGIELIQGLATNVDLKGNRVAVGDQEYGYGKLILATGCKAIRASRFGVKGDELPNVFYIREEHEAAELAKGLEALDGKGKAVILGGGFIGLECAAVLKGWGLECTVVFPEPHCMARLFNADLAAWMEAEYAARGIKIVKGVAVEEFLSTDGKLSGCRLNSKEELPCDIAVVGVGAVPIVDYCSGLTMEKGGFAVNGSMQTSDPDVFAVGDVAVYASRYGGELTRSEHVDHARKSAAQAALAAMGLEPQPYDYFPYFYSRMFEYTDAPIVWNFFGDIAGECKVCSRGDKSIGAIYVRDGKVVGALLMGSPGPSAEDQAKLRELAQSQPDAAEPTKVFEDAKL